MLLPVGFFLSRAGDLFLYFLGKRLGVEISYKEQSGFISCFVLKQIDLDNPVFMLKDFDFAVGCQKAYIEPDFRGLKTKRAVSLKCTLKNTTFLSIKEKLAGRDISLTPFYGKLSLLIDKLDNILYDTMHMEIIVYSDGVQFPYYEAHSKDIRLSAFGSMTSRDRLNIKVKMYFSPEITRDFPEEIQSLLTQESRGWASYYLHLERGIDRSFLKLESDRFRLNFEQFETR